ncbi:hypothetical protein MNBD_CPR01-431 [hydrothermal vent metagenome]|uniref:SHS2 domain-containing protein n=1 Tax=hydrothermal vent metagenome TaxID=652676 RepID=A0A3B0VKP4_9ZZZZ
MSFFSLLHKKSESVLLIDIGSASIAGTYAHISHGYKPELYYTARVPIRSHENINMRKDMERALTELTKVLAQEGARVFAKETGNGSVDRIVVSVASPWQETHTHIERATHKKPFRFTRHLLNMMVEKSVSAMPGRTQATAMVIATRLNGYEMINPFGKMAYDAEVYVILSSISTDVADSIRTVLRKSFHSLHIEIVAFAPVMFLVLRDLYTEYKDFIIMDVSGEATDILIVKKTVLLEDVSVSFGLNDLRRVAIESGIDSTAQDEPLRAMDKTNLFDPDHAGNFAKKIQTARDAWVQGISDAFLTVRSQYALPRDMLLLADKSAHDFLTHMLRSEDFRPLGLSDDLLNVHYVDPGKLAPYVTHHKNAEGDTFISILSLYVAKGLKEPLNEGLPVVHLPQ